MLTTFLILLPLLGALAVAITPLPRQATAGLAFFVALMEVGLWIVAAGQFDFDDGGLQLGTSREWVESLGTSYSVGFYGFSIWLAGVTVVVCAAAILGAVIWFVGVQAFVLGPFCPYCMVAHGLGATAAVMILARAPVSDPDDKPWKLEKLVFIRPRVARRLYGVAAVGIGVLVLGQVLHRPRTFAVRSLPSPDPGTRTYSIPSLQLFTIARMNPSFAEFRIFSA